MRELVGYVVLGSLALAGVLFIAYKLASASRWGRRRRARKERGHDW